MVFADLRLLSPKIRARAGKFPARALVTKYELRSIAVDFVNVICEFFQHYIASDLQRRR